MTAPNPEGVQRCITAAMDDAGITARDIDAINGHLTATFADPYEIENWRRALDVTPEEFPYINSTKSMVGHCLGAAGAIEAVATTLQVYKGFLHPSMNCEDIHPDIASYDKRIPRTVMEFPSLNVIIKACFGFGDVNSCIVFKRWNETAAS